MFYILSYMFYVFMFYDLYFIIIFMIGKIKGKLVEIEGNVGLIETSSGVFYQVFLTPYLISLYNKQNNLEIYTYLQVKEDTLILFGFENKNQYTFFKLLLTVSGVGPKTAFNIISFFDINDLNNAIKNNDVGFLSRVPGLGKKTAAKIILELSTKLKTEFEFKNLVLSEDDKTVVDALISLGYKSNEAKIIVNQIPKNLSIEEKIKIALKNKYDK